MWKDVGKKLISVLIFLVLSVVLKFVSDVILNWEGGMDGVSSKVSPQHEAVIKGLVVDPDDVCTTLDDVGGLEEAKRELKYDLLLPLTYPAQFYGNQLISNKDIKSRDERAHHSRSRCVRPPTGFLFVGPPGTGKTMTARAIAKECGATFMSLTLSALEDKYFGESSKLLSAAWSYAERRAPTIIFIDEVDGWLSTRREDDGAAATGFKTELLRLIDGVREKGTMTSGPGRMKGAPVIVVAATNNAGMLDPAVKRRLPCVIPFRLPAKREREQILSILTKGEPAKHQGDQAVSKSGGEDAACGERLSLLAERTEGYSGSDLAHCYSVACTSRMRRSFESVEILDRSMCALDEERVGRILDRLPPLEMVDWEAGMGHVCVSKKEGEKSTCTSPSSLAASRDILAKLLEPKAEAGTGGGVGQTEESGEDEDEDEDEDEEETPQHN